MTLEQLLDQPLSGWMDEAAFQSDIVLSSRIRLARNLAGIPFPHQAGEGALQDVVSSLRQSVPDLSNHGQGQYMFIEMEKLQPLERHILVEKHIVSPHHVQEPKHRALIIREDAAVAIMVNEEDHLRIQCLMAGLNLKQALTLAHQIDDVLESRQTFAFHEQAGYLTACPTNVGTGLRASVMLHLPALSITKQMNRIVGAVTKIGLAVRGLYGEGTEAVGNVYQVSNQITLGQSEEEIIDNLQTVVTQLVDQEKNARAALMKEAPVTIADRAWRAYGVLRYAQTISGQEALTLLSEVRLGIDLGLIKEVAPRMFNELLVVTRPNFLQKIAGKTEFQPAERDVFRAQVIREKLIPLQGGKHNV